MTWPPGCPRYKRPTAITVGDASGPHGCRECRDDAPTAKATAIAPPVAPARKVRR